MKAEARIILPTHDNDGMDLKGVHREFKLRLVREFGGFTAMRAEGGWYSEDEMMLYAEDVILYDVAVDEDNDDLERLFQIADEYCGKASQHCIYVRGPNMRVQFVTHTPFAAEIAA